MKFARFDHESTPSLGIVRDDEIIKLDGSPFDNCREATKMKRLMAVIATVLSLSLWTLMAPAADYDDLRKTRSERSRLQNEIATVQIAEALAEFRNYGCKHDVPVGVLSSGVDEYVPELKARLLAGASFLKSEPDIHDRNGAGTYNAALIAAIAPNARILPVKILDKIGQGGISPLVKGIEFGVQKGARILLIPGGTAATGDPGLKEAVARARRKGVLLIAPAGHMRSAERHYPGAFEEVLAVGATDCWDRKEATSNFGDWVSLYAPRVDIKAIYHRGGLRSVSAINPEAAIVAGVAALVLGINTNLRVEEAEEILLTTATAISSMNPGIGPGARRVNALAAVRAARVWGLVQRMR